MSPSSTSLACASGAFVSISRVRKLGWPDRDTVLWPENLRSSSQQFAKARLRITKKQKCDLLVTHLRANL